MIKKIVNLFIKLGIAVAILAALLGVHSIARHAATPMEVNEKTLVYSETFDYKGDPYDRSDLSEWHLYQNKDGNLIEMEKENLQITEEGYANLSIYPVPQDEFDEKYNNSYILLKEAMDVDHTILVVSFKVDEGQEGSTGAWENEYSDGSIWLALEWLGFKGSSGVSYIDPKHSLKSGMSGLRFMLTWGWIPVCTVKVDESVDPFAWNTYKIVAGDGQFDYYVNDVYQGSCNDWGGLVKTFVPHLWEDNYKVGGFLGISGIPDVLNLGFVNPDAPQTTEYDFIEVYSWK